MTTTIRYNTVGQSLGESYSGGTLNGLAVTNTYNGLLQRSAVFVPSKITNLFAYNPAARLTNVSDGQYSAEYTYLANSALLGQITFRDGTTTRMTTTKQYDFLNRLQSIRSVPSALGNEPVTFGYRYNDINQRARSGLEDGRYDSRPDGKHYKLDSVQSDEKVKHFAEQIRDAFIQVIGDCAELRLVESGTDVLTLKGEKIERKKYKLTYAKEKKACACDRSRFSRQRAPKSAREL